MFIAKKDGLIVQAKETREELEQALKLMVYDSVEETDVDYKLYEGSYLTDEEVAQKEAERIALLKLTAADVERGIYQALGMDFDDVVAKVEQIQPEGLDIKALKIELKANNFYRGNPYIDTIGALLGLTSKQLDEFFETNDYKKLKKSEVVEDA